MLKFVTEKPVRATMLALLVIVVLAAIFGADTVEGWIEALAGLWIQGES